MDSFKALITLLAVVNPLAAVPFFIHYTEGYTREQKRRTITTAAFTAFLVIAISALLGLQVLAFFGISLASFQVGGGMLLLTSALSMLKARQAEAHPNDVGTTQEEEESARLSIAVVPLTIPLLTGPATMSTVVIYAEKAQNFVQHGMLLIYGLVVAALVVVCFTLAERIAGWLGKTGINVMTRIMGLMLAAIAVEIMSDGLVSLFPALRIATH
jgi:multiple antibiotic resistance protein